MTFDERKERALALMAEKIDTESRHITQADDNIFTDLGFSEEVAVALLAQSNEDISQVIEIKNN
ncbi:hypothetical protein [Serratia sp. DD3]|uniref:hypothetical protein n=1 Tax=Serratia sp. DD3 TaxID=1410619 RepID=UPI0003C4FC2B|nr:hypothetical protein [Serratia sp. DD3]KEY57133.1 hypothetical protein SRDD_39510 [Serratia sp. DD3]